MWTGEIREWCIINGKMTGRIYGSKNCRWSNWEYPEGSFISIQIYHYPDPNNLRYVPYLRRDGSDLLYESLNNYMHLSLGAEWYWDVKQTGRWNPCPLHFKLHLDNEHVDKDFIVNSGCMVSEYPIGPKYWWNNGIDYRKLCYNKLRFCTVKGYENERVPMTNIEDTEKEEGEVIPLKLSLISGGKDNTGNWLMSLKESSVFLCRHKKDEKDFILVQFHIKKKWGMAVWLHSNFPMHQTGDYFVHSLKFSQQHELVDLLQDGEPDEFRGEGEEGDNT